MSTCRLIAASRCFTGTTPSPQPYPIVKNKSLRWRAPLAQPYSSPIRQYTPPAARLHGNHSKSWRSVWSGALPGLALGDSSIIIQGARSAVGLPNEPFGNGIAEAPTRLCRRGGFDVCALGLEPDPADRELE